MKKSALLLPGRFNRRDFSLTKIGFGIVLRMGESIQQQAGSEADKWLKHGAPANDGFDVYTKDYTVEGLRHTA